MNKKASIGVFFALAAAMLNASIGLISLLLINSGYSAEDIAFLKTILAYIFLTLLLFKTPRATQLESIKVNFRGRNLLIEISICAFLGIFTLFFFETIAYKYGAPPNVVVTLMASAAISTLFLGAIFLKEKITSKAIFGSIFAITGIALISWKGESSLLLLVNSCIAGLGYGCFSILIKKYNLNGGIFLTKYLLLFGSIFLVIPFLKQLHPIQINTSGILGIFALAFFPTILGFYCTTKALKILSASKVQVTELSEPIFSTILTFFIFQHLPNKSFFLGACLIIIGIILINEIKIT